MVQILQSNTTYILIAINLNLIPVTLLLQDTDCTVESLSLVDTVDTKVAVQIVRNLERYCDQPNWRTLFGGHIGMTSHGPVGFASLSAATIGAAIATFVEWEQVQSQTYSGHVVQTSEGVEVVIADQTNDRVFAEFLFEAFAKAMEVLIIQLAGKVTGLKICFQPAFAVRQAILKTELKAQLDFTSEHNKLILPEVLWCMPSPLCNKELHDSNIAKCRQMLTSLENDKPLDIVLTNILIKHFDDVIAQGLSAVSPPTQTKICQHLHLTERTLIRKLKALNTSYKQILITERKQLAERLLKQSQYSVQDIADLLGYREPANFCRAFKSWFGVTPGAFRQQR